MKEERERRLEINKQIKTCSDLVFKILGITIHAMTFT